ncbi:flagellar protein FlgN [Limnoglobus roseus]|uniref:Flagellar protein FlgN n=1 Tax=Limnoglobus roseus TaxID=2598579 RepID=A0A5C1A612_9BACT|nr:flagellar protein FlgN [Limnoglobus roseus]QEL13795.1 hypothetical protein PX52LOC_00653 [Limnoglobus roseus]
MLPTSVPNFQQLTERLLGHLRQEELLLRTSKECLLGVHDALRQGDLNALQVAQPHQEKLAADLRGASEQRATAATAISQSLGLSGGNVTLSELADRLSPTLARQLRDARESMRDALADVVELQRANANLVQTLRSYFSGVLSGLSSADAPASTRYGPTGGRLQTVG